MAVEFAFIAPVLLMLTLGITEFGMAMFEYHRLGEATRRGAREAVIETPMAQLTGITSTAVDCQGPSGTVTCSGGNATSAAESTFTSVVTGMQDILPTLSDSNVHVIYSDSGITDPTVTPGIITPTVTVEIQNHVYAYMILDHFIPGMASSITLPAASTTRMVHTMSQTN
jgi:Flp pilus assembly protein TadG